MLHHLRYQLHVCRGSRIRGWCGGGKCEAYTLRPNGSSISAILWVQQSTELKDYKERATSGGNALTRGCGENRIMDLMKEKERGESQEQAPHL